jgi:AAA+ superfamily predicted ATPase
MLSLNQCLIANRPLTFVIAESEIEVLKYLDETCKNNEYNAHVYSSTLGGAIPLQTLLKNKFNNPLEKVQSTIQVLSDILARNFEEDNTKFEKFILLEADRLLNDAQVVRRIKDIIDRYQLDEDFAVNLIFVSQSVCVPIALERFSEVVFFDLPCEKDLKEKSEAIYKKLELHKDRPADELKKEKAEIVNNLRGLTLFEVEQSHFQSFYIHKKIELDFIRDFKKSAIAKTDLLSLMESNISFDDIGGMENLKKWIQKSSGGWTVEGKAFGLPPLKGLLMVGLPGCGKSLVCKAIGNEWGLPIVNFDPSRIFSSRVGDSETNMRRVLQIVENMSPCILMCDEIEKGLSGLQSSTFSDSGVTARVIGSFLIWMQECKHSVFTIATANNIENMPPELISRFDETFFVNIPQPSEREDIFKIHINKLGHDAQHKKTRNPDKFDLKLLAEKSKDLSGREIEQVLKESMYDAFHSKKDLSTDIILNVLAKKTNLLTSMGEQLKYLLTWVGFDEERNDGVRARFASTPSSLDLNRVQSEIDALIKDTEGKKPFEG